MINLSMLKLSELRRLAEAHAHKESTDDKSRAYILELTARLKVNYESSDAVHNRPHNRIEES